MAIKVSNTEVISDSRGLNNIVSIDATTAATIGALGVGGSTDFGAVGSYAFLRSTSNSATISPNTNYSGSSLNYTSIHRSAGNNILMPTNGGQPVGTWRSMGGGTDNVFGGTNWAATLFVRIS
jgi:hypothetical protein